MKYPANFLNVQQGTPEWLMSRVGCVGASSVEKVVAKLKNGKESAARASYKLELLTEILTGRAVEHYVSTAMDWGTETEPLARSVYEMFKGVEVDQVGFVLHPTIKRSGASPDGMVGEDGLLEIKCPNTTTHLAYLIDGIVPDQYKPQMMWQMACTGRQWCDFASYDPRLPSEYGLFVVRYNRDDKLIAEMESEVAQFIGEVNSMCEKLLKYKSESGPTMPSPPKAEIPEWTTLEPENA